MKKIIIDLITANVCNKICKYCPIKFNWKLLSLENIDVLIDYLNRNIDVYDKCIINFFWGEPLLNFKSIKYFIEKNTNKKLEYSLWTNWFLLNQEIFEFLVKYNVKIYLSFHADDSQTYRKLLEKDFLLQTSNLDINFIVSPINLDLCYEKIDLVIKKWFKKINIIPIMLTQKWELENIKELSKFISYIDINYIENDNYSDLVISKFSFFDGISDDKNFVIDYDLNIFQDSSDELYIWKQYDLLWEEIITEIQQKTFLWNVFDDVNLDIFFDEYSSEDITKLVYKLPKKMWYVKDYYLIHKIMNKNNKHSRMWNNIIF